MGKVKAWAMGIMEDAQSDFVDGQINARQCAERLNSSGLMDPDEIEVFIDEHTALRAKNIAHSMIDACAIQKDE